MAALLNHLLPIRQFALLVFTLTIVGGCTAPQAEEGRARAFFYPLPILTDGLVYEYLPVNEDNSPPFYYYHRSFFEGDSTILATTYYDYSFAPFQFSRQRIYKNGVEQKDMRLFFPDSTSNKQQEVRVDVVYDDVFPFFVSDSSGVLLTELQWDGPEPNRTTSLIRNRRYIGDTSHVFKGKTADALVFDLKELIRLEEDGVTETDYGGVEIYRQGLGLVYFKKKISDSFVIEYQLNDTFPMETLEKRFRNYLEE